MDAQSHEILVGRGCEALIPLCACPPPLWRVETPFTRLEGCL